MHFCQDELFALLAIIPGLSYAGAKVRALWHLRRACKHQETAE